MSKTCNVLRHLRGACLSVQQFALRTTAGGKSEFFASNKTCAEETGYSASVCGMAKAALVQNGWLEPKGGNQGSGKTGSFAPNRFLVLDHAAWAEKHPGLCGTKPRLTTIRKSAVWSKVPHGTNERNRIVKSSRDRTAKSSRNLLSEFRSSYGGNAARRSLPSGKRNETAVGYVGDFLFVNPVQYDRLDRIWPKADIAAELDLLDKWGGHCAPLYWSLTLFDLVLGISLPSETLPPYEPETTEETPQK